MARKSVMSAGQVNEDRLEDADGDTLVQVEESADEDKIRFDTAGVERAIITEAGRVGIGISTPDTVLHIEGADSVIRLDDTTSNYRIDLEVAGGLKLMMGTTTNSDAYMTLMAHAGLNKLDTVTRDFHIYGTNTTTGFYFDESEGNFGVGTTGPDRKLDVLDASNPQLRLTHTDGSKYVDFKATPAGDLWIKPSNANGHTKFISDSNSSIVIQSADVGDSDAILSFSVDGGSSIPWSIGVDDSDADKLKFGTATPDTNSRLTIDSNGAVGVGTTTPNSTLDVNGSRSTRIDSVTGNVTIDHTHHTVLMGNGDVDTTCTLPSVSSGIQGRIYTFKKIGRDSCDCFVHAASGEEIDGQVDAELELVKKYDVLSVQCDGSVWWIVGEIRNP